LRHGVFPRFVSRFGSHAYSTRSPSFSPALAHGRGLLVLGDQLTEPCNDIIVVSMGFPQDTVDIPGLSSDQRKHLLGQCVDANVGMWIALAIGYAASSEVALPCAVSFPHTWMFDTGATSHMLASFFDSSSYAHMPRRWISGLCAYVVGSGTIHLTF
jgi:hypothetical protein